MGHDDGGVREDAREDDREGGEPACLLARVCPECGRVADRPLDAETGACGDCATPPHAELQAGRR